MVSRAIKSSAPIGGLVGVPFAGTGPEFIAGEQLERRIFGAEITPAYVDVIVSRWESFTGQAAKRQR
jgi:DNA modification methylase